MLHATTSAASSTTTLQLLLLSSTPSSHSSFSLGTVTVPIREPYELKRVGNVMSYSIAMRVDHCFVLHFVPALWLKGSLDRKTCNFSTFLFGTSNNLDTFFLNQGWIHHVQWWQRLCSRQGRLDRTAPWSMSSSPMRNWWTCSSSRHRSSCEPILHSHFLHVRDRICA